MFDFQQSSEVDTIEVDSRSWIHMPPRLPHAVRALEPSIVLLSMLKSR